MPAGDRYHGAVRRALEKDGWTVTHDPLRVRAGNRFLFIDIGAEPRDVDGRVERRIAVEVKPFGGPSVVEQLYATIGQVAI